MHWPEHSISHLHEELLRANPMLNPEGLQQLFPAYKRFHPVSQYGSNIYASTQGLAKLNERYLQQSKVLFPIGGLSAAGKDHIRKKLEAAHPDLTTKLVTATTRERRADKNEEDKVDYYFYPSVEAFMAEVSQGNFVETAEVRPGVFYGLPKYSLDDAMKQTSPVITTHTELSGWGTLSDVAASLNMPVVTTFLLPNIPFSEYLTWLKTQRPGEFEPRVTRTIWELAAAPKADLLILNTLDEKKAQENTEAVVNVLAKLLLNLTQ